jgi:CDP-diacylglycerol--glycerol-3-phosphate 3-phosphatidyltransferase
MKFFSPPNQLTFLRILLTPVFIVFLLSSDLLLRQWSLAIFILAAITDWYDGWLARRWGYVTRWGALFDPFADKVLISAALIAYSYIGLIAAWMVWIIVVRDAVITVLRSYAEHKGKPVVTSNLAKIKTLFQYLIIYYLLVLYVGQNIPWFRDNYGTLIQSLLNYSLIYSVMAVITILTIWTCIAYFFDNWQTIRELYDGSKKSQIPSNHLNTVKPSFAINLFASALFSGYSPVVSGTVGSAVALAFYFIPGFELPLVISTITLIVFLLGIKASAIMEQQYGHDPSEVTIDEVVGMWISLFLLPKKIFIVLAAFFIFRIFDIIKPFPAKKFDRMHGGFGIMMDDVIAGIYANIILQLALLIPFIKNLLLM